MKNWSYFVIPFLFLFIVFFLAVNWVEIGWMFDWQIWRRIGEETTTPQDPDSPTEKGDDASGEPDRLVVPALGIDAPLRTPAESESTVLMAELDRGVVLYPGLAKPGEKGRAVILGHSAPPGYPDIKFDRIFSELGDLQKGDRLEVYYNERLFVYSVEGIQTMSIQQYDDFLNQPSADQRILIISTCYPPGRDWQRWVVTSSLLTE